ncbi:MAG: 8-oxo-dGTP diphosphatase [Patescibacteria group bacterium]
MKLTTLCYVIIQDKILLAKKKRGLGVGKWNGPGGKALPGETPEQACSREFFEETGARVNNLEHRGIIEFIFENKPDWNQQCHIFVSGSLIGEPQETQEMLPAWFFLSEIPYHLMWEDDPIWLPGVVAGGKVSMRFIFNEAGNLTGCSNLESGA